VSDFQSIRYGEFTPPALESIARAAKARGLSVKGTKGDDAHTYGAHLSLDRLHGTGRRNDYTAKPPPSARYRAAVAGIDIGLDQPWAGEWVEDVRARCRTGAIGFLGEIIGDPDLIHGPRVDTKDSLRACAPEWTWQRYDGDGHITWAHFWVLRDRLADAGLGARLFEGWGLEGRNDDMTPKEVEAIVRNMDWKLTNHTYTKLATILDETSKVADRNAGEGRKQLIREVRDAVLLELRASGREDE
jgi:hypothetical protein